MKKRIRSAADRVAKNPVLQKSAQSLKPNRSIWGCTWCGVFLYHPGDRWVHLGRRDNRLGTYPRLKEKPECH